MMYKKITILRENPPNFSSADDPRVLTTIFKKYSESTIVRNSLPS